MRLATYTINLLLSIFIKGTSIVAKMFVIIIIITVTIMIIITIIVVIIGIHIIKIAIVGDVVDIIDIGSFSLLMKDMVMLIAIDSNP